MSQEFYLILVT